jgi:dihydrolipoamide dehydrogenase
MYRRKSNVDSLNLENTTLQLNKLGILVFDAKTLQCGTAPVFIAGDANNILLLLHEAADEGKMAGRNAAHYPDIEVLPRRAPISIVSADPQIAMVGQRYVDQEPRNIVTEAMDFTDQGRS